MTRLLILSAVLSLCAACMDTTRPDPAYQPVEPQRLERPPVQNGSLYSAASVSLFDDLRAARAGDILTVILTESTDASKSASTVTAKQNDVEIGNPTLFGTPLDLGGEKVSNLGMNLNSSQEFSGNGASTQSNSLQGRISVVVAEVLPNGNLVIRGEKILGLNQGDEFVRVSGIVRPVDVRPDNSVLSTQIANARIEYGGNGPVSSASIVGWLAKFFLTFSPF